MLTKLLHMGLQVNNFGKARDFFCGGLGMESIYTGTIGEFKHILDPAVDPASDQREQMGYIRICPGQYFEMFEGALDPPDFDPKPIRRFPDMAFAEVGLGVADRQDALRRLREKGLPLRDGCVFDPDGNPYRLIEVGGPVREHLIVSLAYVAMRVNDMEAAVGFYSRLGMQPRFRDNGDVEMCLATGSLLLVKSAVPVKPHRDTALYHLAYATDSFADLEKSAARWADMGIPSYRNVTKDEVLKTGPGQFDPDVGPDGSIGLRLFDPDGNCCEVIYMPEDNRQNRFEREHPFF